MVRPPAKVEVAVARVAKMEFAEAVVVMVRAPLTVRAPAD